MQIPHRLLLLFALLSWAGGSQAGGADIAQFSEPTARYAHAVLGDAVEYGALEIKSGNRHITIRLPESHVFEDLKPRLADVDFDGDNEVIVVETDMSRGAALAVYDETGKLAETPHIGRPHRWLAPLGAADLDGDGHVEIAYIDRPHLAKTLRIWRFENNTLTEIATAPGLTNHRIGDDFIQGGIRDCGEGSEILTADASWRNIIATRLSESALQSRILAPYTGRESLAGALICP